MAVDGDTAVIAGYGASGSGVFVFRGAGTNWTQVAKLVPPTGSPTTGWGMDVAISGTHRRHRTGLRRHVCARRRLHLRRQRKRLDLRGEAAVDGNELLFRLFDSALSETRWPCGAHSATRCKSTDAPRGAGRSSRPCGRRRWWGRPSTSATTSRSTATGSRFRSVRERQRRDAGRRGPRLRSRGGTWSESTRLVAPDALAYDNFGTSLALRADTLIVGAVWNLGGAPRSSPPWASSTSSRRTARPGPVRRSRAWIGPPAGASPSTTNDSCMSRRARATTRRMAASRICSKRAARPGPRSGRSSTA